MTLKIGTEAPVKKASTWQRTSVSNLLRNAQSGKYYARVKVSGKQKWKSLETDVLTVAKLRLGDVEKELREQARAMKESTPHAAADALVVERFIRAWSEETRLDSTISPATRLRRQISIKAVVKTWPDLPSRDIRRVTKAECASWSARALAQGTGFRPPGSLTPAKKGMSASAFNKAVDAMRAVFEIARTQGVIFANPAATITKAPVAQKRLKLPSSEQFREMVRLIGTAGDGDDRNISGAVLFRRQDRADLIRFLAFSGVRISEAASLQWHHVDWTRGVLHVPGTKTRSSDREIPLFPPLRDLLKEIQTRRSVEAAQYGLEADTVLSPILRAAECSGALKRACELLKIRPLTHHDLRHLFATRCIESGVDIPTVSRWLGHSDGGALAMRTYGHLRDEHSLAQAAKVSF